MRKFLIITLAFLFVPVGAFAHGPVTEREIIFSSLTQRTPVALELDLQALDEQVFHSLIIDDNKVAVPSERYDDHVNIMSKVIFDRVPNAADTVQKTEVGQLIDGSSYTYFQPELSDTYVFLFHFEETVAPTELSLNVTDGSFSSVRVRLGPTAGSLKDATTKPTSSSTITLSGETGKYFEVTARLNQGIPRLAELSLFAPRSRIGFNAEPGRQYSLLYSHDPFGNNSPRLYNFPIQNAVPVVLGPETPVFYALEDFDGLKPSEDNCPEAWNTDQKDTDEDGLGDACDNCPTVSNAGQEDSDRNGRGNVCEDVDRDGTINALDNCLVVSNPAQADEDHDGMGNLCDPSDDRWSETRPWLLYTSMTMIVLALLGLTAFILRRSNAK